MAIWESTTTPVHLYSMNAVAARRHVPIYPERTAWRSYRPILWSPEESPLEMLFQVWPTREAMLDALRQPGCGCWTPWL